MANILSSKTMYDFYTECKQMLYHTLNYKNKTIIFRKIDYNDTIYHIDNCLQVKPIQGEIKTTFDTLYKTFGEPKFRFDNCAKLELAWNIQFELEYNHKIEVSIYNWKGRTNYLVGKNEDIPLDDEWWIGCESKEGVELVLGACIPFGPTRIIN